jgi:hypothetical protein
MMATSYSVDSMTSKDSSRPPAPDVDDYWMATVIEDRAESAAPPSPQPTEDER